MAALFLTPLYILINFYVVQWMIRWMGTCHRLFQTMAFRITFVGVYIILATALLTGFLIKKPAALHRVLKHIGNYFLGTFLYILMVIAVVDLGRLILKYIFHAPFIGQRSTFVITGLICTILIISLSVYGILHVSHVKATPYEVTVAKAVDGIYDSDPKVNPKAVKYDEISIQEVVDKKLAAMDLTASIMCLEQKMPMLVFGLEEENSIVNAVHGKFTGTKVTV